jgi:hypothetical protein
MRTESPIFERAPRFVNALAGAMKVWRAVLKRHAFNRADEPETDA